MCLLAICMSSISYYTHTHTHTRTHACMHAHTHTHAHACMHTHTHARARMHACTHTHTSIKADYSLPQNCLPKGNPASEATRYGPPLVTSSCYLSDSIRGPQPPAPVQPPPGTASGRLSPLFHPVLLSRKTVLSSENPIS